MSTFRSYFLKNNTLISNNVTNNSQNPVTEISYGTANKQVSRFIFDVDLTNLRARISEGFINPKRIVKHVLHMTNTINYAQQYIGKKSYMDSIERASSFDLQLFKVDEEWDEGSGYDFVYNDSIIPNVQQQVSNWTERKTGVNWTTAGAYLSGTTQVIGTQRFDKGAENINIDITDYINDRLTGNTSSYGMGIKFTDVLEDMITEFRQAVAFHTKYTNTFYEPYIETIVDDTITDDRNYFYQDKDNDLYLYVNVGGFQQDITVNKVDIYDHEDNLINTLTGTSIVNVSKGIYKITLNISNLDYPDSVIFRDEWSLTINGRDTVHHGEFYLISAFKYYNFDKSNEINFDNYFFYFYGISERELVRANNIRKIKLTIRELYPNQDDFLPLDIEYRLFTTVGKKYEIDIIPFTTVNRTKTGYEFNLDTSWLIPQDYFLQIRMRNGNYYENKQTLGFTVVSDNILKN